MCKKVFGVIIVLAIAMVAAWNFNQSGNEIELSDLALSNMEALADGEYPEIPGFNDKVVYKTWNYNYSPPRIQTSCYDGGSQVCA